MRLAVDRTLTETGFASARRRVHRFRVQGGRSSPGRRYAVDVSLAHAPEVRAPNPDELSVPESRDHRRLRELTAEAMTRALGNDWDVDSNLNVYASRDARAFGPDAMTTQAGHIPPKARSYRVDDVDGPMPAAVVEIPSDSDTVPEFREKLRRYQRLGIVVYVAYVSPSEPNAERIGPNELSPLAWLDRPCPELGGIAFVADGGDLVIRTHDGIVVRSVDDLVRHFTERASEAERRASEAEQKAREAQARATRLAERLRVAGLDTG